MRDAPAVKLLILLIILVPIILVILTLPLAWMELNEDIITTADSGKSADVLMLKKKGWIPESLPETVTEFHEAHSIDTDYTIMRFDYDGDVDQLTSGACVRADNLKGAETDLYGLLFTKDWWPVDELKSEVTRGAWPVYHCRFDGTYHRDFWLMRSPQQRYYLWHKR